MSTNRCDIGPGSALALLIALLWLLPVPASAWESSGHLKALLFATEAPPLPFGDDGFLASGGLRLNLTHNLDERVHFEAAIDNQLLYRDPKQLAALPASPPGRLVDLDHDWSRNHAVSDRLQIDRLLLRGRSGPLDWSVGRQAIGFGRIVLVSPLDVINPFPPDAIDTDVRPGVDALRTLYSLDSGGQLGATAVFDDDASASSALLSFTDTLHDVDLLLLTGSLRSRPMLGVGAAGSLGPLGVKSEASFYQGEDVGRPGGDLYSNYALAALELWYRFDSGIVLLAEGLYNGVGSNRPANYPQVLQSAPLQEGLSTLLGKRYLLLAPSWEIHPLLTASTLALWNLGDDSALLRPQLALSLADNVSLDLFYAITVGPAPVLGPGPGALQIRSEFGSYGDSGGALLRCYF